MHKLLPGIKPRAALSRSAAAVIAAFIFLAQTGVISAASQVPQDAEPIFPAQSAAVNEQSPLAAENSVLPDILFPVQPLAGGSGESSQPESALNDSQSIDNPGEVENSQPEPESNSIPEEENLSVAKNSAATPEGNPAETVSETASAEQEEPAIKENSQAETAKAQPQTEPAAPGSCQSEALSDKTASTSPSCLPTEKPLDESQSQPEILDSKLVEIVNTNDVKVTNEAVSGSTTGDNAIVSEDGGENAAIDTGDINVYANVLNIVNTNLYDSKITEIVQNFDSLSADLFLNDPGASSQELAQDLVAKVCNEVECKSLSSFTLTSNNLAEVENNAQVSGSSGNNLIENVEEGAAINTGNVNAVVNVLNIVNTNLVNSRWTFASINIFGDWQGDLVLPSEMYFSGYMTIGSEADAQANLKDIKKVIIDIQNDNQAEIINNVNAGADSGNNAIAATGTEEGKKGDLEDSAIETGDAQAASNVQNHANINIYNGKWYLGLVNTLGRWSGNVYSLPQQVAMAETPGGLSFFSSTSGDTEELYELFGETVAQIQNASSSGNIAEISITGDNNAAITNNVDVQANTGGNGIISTEVELAKIRTGNAYALANIINFANSNLINSDLQVGLVNIFGKWTGNIVFGFPDLSVAQSQLSEKFPKEKGRTAALEIAYENLGPSSMDLATLEWQFNPEIISLAQPFPALPYTQPQPGTIQFEIGKLGPQSSGKLSLAVETLSDLQDGDKITSFARISGSGPETNKSNNESLIEMTAVATEQPSGGGGGNGGAGGNGGGNGSGGNAQPYDILRVYKTNTSKGAPLKAEDKVAFTLTVHNDGLNQLDNVILYDTLKSPAGEIIWSKTFPLGKMLPKEEVIISYEIEITASTASGTYANSAHASVLNGNLKGVASQQTALSLFIVSMAGSKPGNGSPEGSDTDASQAENDEKTGTEAPNNADQAQNSTTSTPAVLGIVQNSSQKPTPNTAGQVKGASAKIPSQTNPPAKAAGQPLDPFANKAEAAGERVTFFPAPGLPSSNAWSDSPFDRMSSLFFLAFLIAFGYAAANLVSRIRKTRKQADENAAPLQEFEVVDYIPIAPIIKNKRKKKENGQL